MNIFLELYLQQVKVIHIILLFQLKYLNLILFLKMIIVIYQLKIIIQMLNIIVIENFVKFQQIYYKMIY